MEIEFETIITAPLIISEISFDFMRHNAELAKLAQRKMYWCGRRHQCVVRNDLHESSEIHIHIP